MDKGSISDSGADISGMFHFRTFVSVTFKECSTRWAKTDFTCCKLVLFSPKDAGWKSSFDTMYNGLPKQRQDSWVHTVRVLFPSLPEALWMSRLKSLSRPVFFCLQISADPAQKSGLSGDNSGFKPEHADTATCGESDAVPSPNWRTVTSKQGHKECCFTWSIYVL